MCFNGTILKKVWIIVGTIWMYLCFVCTSTFCMVNRRKKINCVVVNVDSSPKKVDTIKGQIFDQLQNGLKLPAAKHCTRLSGRRVILVESLTYREYWYVQVWVKKQQWDRKSNRLLNGESCTDRRYRIRQVKHVCIRCCCFYVICVHLTIWDFPFLNASPSQHR